MVLNAAFFATVVPIVHSIFCLCKGDYETSTWYLIYRMIGPFDSTSILGWYMMWLVQLYVAYTYSFVVSAVSTHFLSCSFYIEACCEQLLSMFKMLDTIIQNEKEKLKRFQVKKQIGDAVAFHIDTMR